MFQPGGRVISAHLSDDLNLLSVVMETAEEEGTPNTTYYIAVRNLAFHFLKLLKKSSKGYI